MRRSLIAVVLLVLGCSSGAPAASPSPAPPTPTAPPTVAQTATPAVSAAPSPTSAPSSADSCDPDYDYGCYTALPSPIVSTAIDVVVGISSGGYLVGPNGLSLYVFDNDAPSASSCEGGCADNWPALTIAAGQAPVAGEGVGGELTTFERAGAIYQVAYNDRPLYYYSGDSAPGDVNGDGIGGVWHLAMP